MGTIKESLTFDDVLLIPKYSDVLPSETDISLNFSKKITLKVPFLSSAMDTVTESEMAVAIAHAGGIGVIHRNLKIRKQSEEVMKVKKKKLIVGAAVGTNNEDVDRARSLIDNGCDLLVIDTAHGHSAKVLKALSKLKKIKHLHLDTCIIDWKTATSFFKNLYKLPNLERFTLNADSYLRSPPSDGFPKNLYPKKLKDFEIVIPKEIKDDKPKDEFIHHKGYAGSYDDLYFMHRILQVDDFPNFEKIKTFEKLRYYNYFTKNNQEGGVISRLVNGYTDFNRFKKLKKLKDIWIYGYDFKKAEELKNTSFLQVAKEILKYKKLRINGISEKTFKTL